MRIVILLLLPIITLFSQQIDNSFITKFEYGAMLYKNPRGIGCHLCHASGNQTVVIARFKDKNGQTQALEAPPIDQVDYASFKKKLRASRFESKVMPTYFLTDDEINSIYHYITNLNK